MRSKRDITYKKILSLFRNQNGSPFFNAKGLAIGVFSGCFPFFGFQTLIGVFFAKLAKGNIVLAAIGTWVSNPFTYIPLYYFNYKVGSIFFFIILIIKLVRFFLTLLLMKLLKKVWLLMTYGNKVEFFP